jgi:myosin heavy subunit
MEKRNSVNVEKIIIDMLLVIGMFFVSGCDSEFEQKNIQLKRELAKMESFNTSLTASLEKVTKDNNNLKNTLEKMRENNKGLNVSLAKSELEFSKKHKAELDAEKQKLNDEREAFRQEKVSIEKTAYENAKQTVSTMYLFIIGLIMIVLLIIFILLVKNKKDNKKVIEEKNADIEEIQFKNDKIKKSLKEKDERIIALENQIKDLERLQKSNSKNQVVQKIEEYTRKREQKLDRLEGDRHGK